MYSELTPYLTAFVIGLLIGIERERSQNQDGLKSIMGARTLPLIGLIGCLIASTNNIALILTVCAFILLIIFINEVRWNFETKEIDFGSTSAVAAILVFLLGFAAYTNSQISVILGVIVFVSLAVKDGLHSFARTGISQKEMSAAVTFLISAFVILPLLPDDFIDPWGLIHPTRIWLLFVLIAGVQFFSYIALRSIGNKWGMLLSGLLGGFVSATATTLSLAMKADSQPGKALLISSAIVLAEVSSLLIQILVLLIMISQVSLKMLIVLAVPATIGAIMALATFLYTRRDPETEEVQVSLDNPISLKRTLTFAMLISIGLILIAWASSATGVVGVYVTSALGGLASMRVVTFSVTELVNTGDLTTAVAAASILLAMSANMIIKLAIIRRAGSSKLFYICSIGFLIMLLGGLSVYFINPLMDYGVTA